MALLADTAERHAPPNDNQSALSNLIWSIAERLGGDYPPSEYGRVILPFAVLRRIDCALEDARAAAIAEHRRRTAEGRNPEPFVRRVTGLGFYNAVDTDPPRIAGAPQEVSANLLACLDGFSPAVRDLFEKFEFAEQVDRLEKSGLLFQVVEMVANFPLHPRDVTNMQMGLVFEELIRRFAEASNDTAGERFTPREVIRLMVDLLFVEDDDVLTRPGVVRTIHDPTAGTGGMLSVADEHLKELNPEASLVMHGQELNALSYAICKADMLIKGQDVSRIVHGDTLSDDGHAAKHFDDLLANPPFGVDWKKVQGVVQKERKDKGHDGRFGPGLPRVSDGSLLFLMHLLSKMRPAVEGGARFAIVLNGSPLFTGAAGGGESEIRRHVLESDLVEAIIGLPADMFYNTGIATYAWVPTNRKPAHRKGLVQLIDTSSFWGKMRKSLGAKRREMSEDHIRTVASLFGGCFEAQLATILDAEGKEVSRQVATEDDAPPFPRGRAGEARPPVAARAQ